jgi:hydrogenase expression/formation protein HypC
MCLAIPGKVLSVQSGVTPLMGRVSFSGVEKEVCLEWIPDVRPGEYVIVHVGFAITKMDEEEALETLRVIREAGELAGELGPEELGPDAPGPDEPAEPPPPKPTGA